MDVLASANGGQRPAGGTDAQSAITEGISAIRAINQQAQSTLGKYPSLAPHVNQLQQLLQQMMVTLVQSASTQTESADALPMAGQ